MTKRSKITFAAGLAVFAVGAVSLAASARGSGEEGARQATTAVLFAAKPIPAGTTGATAVGQGLVGTRKVAAGARPAGALSDVSQLSGRAASTAIEQGSFLLDSEFPAAQTRIGTVRIPPDKTALAIQMGNVPGVAGFAGAGDRIDIYGVLKAPADNGAAVRLVMQDVEVLNVNGSVLASAQGQPGGQGLVFLVAVTPADAERLVYLVSFEQLYFSLVPREHSPVESTPGAGPSDSLTLSS